MASSGMLFHIAVTTMAEEEQPKTVCTCGAKNYRRDKRVQPLGNSDRDNSSVKKPELKRSLWRKLLGKGPKCICVKRLFYSDKGVALLKIPQSYVGGTFVVVSGRRVPYTREMQKLRRQSWDPLEAIEED